MGESFAGLFVVSISLADKGFHDSGAFFIYNTGAIEGAMDALVAMREYLEPEEKELCELTDSTLGKLEHMTDEEYTELELFPDFDEG